MGKANVPELAQRQPDADWEAMWAAYDPGVYRRALEQIGPQDVVVDIGAGDLRLALRMAAVARRVIAIERNPAILGAAAPSNCPLPSNLMILCADALETPFPDCVTIGVLLMRHCTHFRRYVEKLRLAGCRWLITNARWGMDVERVDLQAARRSYCDAAMGWWACECGAVGFKTGPAEDWTEAQDVIVHEIKACPQCEPVH